MVRSSITVAILLGSRLLGQTPAVTIDLDRAFAKHGIEVMPSTASGFRPALESLLAKDDVKALEPVHPYILAIKNGTDQAIRTIVLISSQINTEGRAIGGELVFHLDGRREAFPRGATFLFAPDEQLTASLLHYVFRDGPPASALSGTFAARRDTLLGQVFDPHRFLKTTVSLDSATLSDGSVIGPDKAGLVDREFRKGLIENSLLRKLLDESISDADLSTLLDEDIKQWRQNPPLKPNTGLAEEVGIYRYQLERFLSKSLREFGRSLAAEGLKSMIEKKAAVPALHNVKE